MIATLAMLIIDSISPQPQVVSQSQSIIVSQSTQFSQDSSASQTIISNGMYSEWDIAIAYNGGDTVVYQNKIYRAKWWTQGEAPDISDVWDDTLQTPSQQNKEADKIIMPEHIINKDEKAKDFKVVGYYPAWDTQNIGKLRFDVLTHVIYAFAIPTSDGKLLPLESPNLAKQIIELAHKNDAKVLLAIGGWSYNDVPLEPTFAAATDTLQKTESFADEIIKLCDTYGFDGIDMDWEHPRKDGTTGAQYERLMLILSEKLHAKNKLLTSAVISGATADKNIYYDAAAHTDKVLDAVDWLNVMAYDGGEGERHSSYDFAVDCVQYWGTTRKLASEKIVLGVPFYARPSWATYEDILIADSNAHTKDNTEYNGMTVWYNGIDTIQNKTNYALQNAGGIMIWEISQDTADTDKSLLLAIGNALTK